MSVIVVDLQRLCELRRQCAILNDAFAARDRTVALSADDIGPGRVVPAILSFESHWNDGQTKVRNHLDAMLARLDSAIATYRDCETDLAQQMEESQ